MPFWDTSKDPRLLAALKAVDHLSALVPVLKGVGSARKKEAAKALSRIRSTIEAMRYSYLSPRELIQTSFIEALKGDCKTIRTLIESSGEDLRRKLSFYIRVICGLSRRLALGEVADPAFATDIYIGKIFKAYTHPEKRDLKVCLVSVGEEEMTVVTNDPTYGEGDEVAVAILPPRAFGNVVSEGMFLRKCPGGEVGTIPKCLEDQDLSKIRGMVLSLISGG